MAFKVWLALGIVGPTSPASSPCAGSVPVAKAAATERAKAKNIIRAGSILRPAEAGPFEPAACTGEPAMARRRGLPGRPASLNRPLFFNDIRHGYTAGWMLHLAGAAS